MAGLQVRRFLVAVTLTVLATTGVPDTAWADASQSRAGQPNAESITRLYWATLNRAPDPAGFHYWSDKQSNGLSLLSIAESFLHSAEWQQRYGRLSDGAFVEGLYQNVLGRPADRAGQRYWLQRASAGMGRAHMLLLFSESEEFIRNIGLKNSADGGLAWTPARHVRCHRLPRSVFDILVDPTESSTWGPRRSQGQLVIYDRFNPGETQGNFVNTIGLANLSFNHRNEIHGPPLPN